MTSLCALHWLKFWSHCISVYLLVCAQYMMTRTFCFCKTGRVYHQSRDLLKISPGHLASCHLPPKSLCVIPGLYPSTALSLYCSIWFCILRLPSFLYATPKDMQHNFRFLLLKHCSEWMLHNPHIISSTLNWKETKKITIFPCNHMGPREDTMSSALELGHNLRHLAWQKKKWLLA